ncbi:E3 ubiquitin-protein ligase RBBP6 [Osmerus mordax]|uniref:E3 ubiquitin-protein ligase RBBP6-like n=1 Tax=Osmerus mordax TaxID=8014 RepID=UPI0035106499
MACVHYKFSSKLQYDTVTFDGLHITLSDLKRQIMGREKLKAGDCDLQITNAQTKEEYHDDTALITKNSSVIIKRIPLGGVKATNKTYLIGRSDHHHVVGPPKAMDDHAVSVSLAQLSKTANLAEANASEDDKIRAMMSQSNHDYDPIHYTKKLSGPPPPNYTCFRCGKNGHYIRNCPTNGDKSFEAPQRIKKSTGIPRSFMMEVDDPSIKGAMLTNTGRYAIPTIDAEAYAIGKKEKPPFVAQAKSSSEEDEDPIPDELLCLLCKDLMTDAVVIPCCGNSYCDDCVRTSLLESDEHICPTCGKSDVSPDALIANKFLRQAVNNFKNETGYTKRMKKGGPPDSAGSAQPPIPAPPQPRLLRPYQQTRSQQDPLMPRPPAADTPPLAQQPGTPPIGGKTAAGSSSHSTPAASPQHLPSHVEPPVKEVEDLVPTQSVVVSADPPAPTSLLPTGYHVQVLTQPPPLSHALHKAGPPPRPNPPRHSGGPPSWDTSGGHDRPHSDQPQHSHLPPSQPPPSSGPLPLFPPPPSLFSSTQHLPPLLGVGHPQYPPPHYPPGQPPSSYPVPPPGFPPVPGVMPVPPWPPSTSQPPPLPSAPIPSLSSAPHPSFLSKDDFYRQQRRMKEDPPSLFSGRASDKSKLEEFTNDFAKELLEYRKMQKERRRSYSRSKSPYRGSSYSGSSRSYSKSRSRSPRSYSRSVSRSRSRSSSRPRLRSRSYSRSPYPRRPARPRTYRSRSRGYRRSRSRSPPHYRGRDGPGGGYRSRSRSPGPGGYRNHTPPAKKPGSDRERPVPEAERKYPGRERYRDKEPLLPEPKAGFPPRAPDSTDSQERERYHQWEREYREWYEKYYKSYSAHLPPVHPPPFRARPSEPYSSPTDRYAQPRHTRNRDTSPRSSPFRRGGRREEYSPPTSAHSPGPASKGRTAAMTYQERCLEKYGQQPIVKPDNKENPRGSTKDKEPANFTVGVATVTSARPGASKPGAHSHRKQKKKRKGEDARGGGESSFSASDSTEETQRKERKETSDVNDAGRDDATPVRDEPMESDASALAPPPPKPDRAPSDRERYERRDLAKSDKAKRKSDSSGTRRDDNSSYTSSRTARKREPETDTLKTAHHKTSPVRAEDQKPPPAELAVKRLREEILPVKPDPFAPECSQNLQTAVSLKASPHLSHSKPDRQPDQLKAARTKPDGHRQSESEPDQARPSKEDQRVWKEPAARQDRESAREDKPKREAERAGRAVERSSGSNAPDTKPEKRRRREERGRKEVKSTDDKELNAPGGREEPSKIETKESPKPDVETQTDEEEREKETLIRPLIERGMRGKIKININMEGKKKAGGEGGVQGPAAISSTKVEKVERSKSRGHRRVLAPDGSAGVVDYTSASSTGGSPLRGGGLSAEDRLEQRKTIVKTLEEYTNDSSTPAEDEIVLIQVPRSKWEKEDSEEEGEKEEAVTVQAKPQAPPHAPLPPPLPPLPTLSVATESLVGRARVKERDQEREVDRVKGSSRPPPEKALTPTSEKGILADTQRSKAQISPAEKDRQEDKDKEQARERERESERERFKERQRAKESGGRERGKERERDRSSTSSREATDKHRPPHSSSSSSTSSHPSERERRERERERTGERGSDHGSEKSSSSSSHSSLRDRPAERKPSDSRDHNVVVAVDRTPTDRKPTDRKPTDHRNRDPREKADQKQRDHLDVRHRDGRDDREPGRPPHRRRDSPPDPHRSRGWDRDSHMSDSSSRNQAGRGWEPVRPSKSSPGSDRTQDKRPPLPPSSTENQPTKGATKGEEPRAEGPSGRKESQQDSQGTREMEVRSVREPLQPDCHQQPPRRDKPKSPHVDQEREGERDGERRGKEKGRENPATRSPSGLQPDRQQSDPVRETDEAAFVPDYSESESLGSESEGRMDDRGREGRQGEDRRREARKERADRREDRAEAAGKMDAGKGPEGESSRSSSVSSTCSQDSRKDEKKRDRKEKKKLKKHKKHKKHKRQASLECEEGELKGHKHKKKKSRKNRDKDKEGQGRGAAGEGDGEKAEEGRKEEATEEEEQDC